MSAMKQTRKDAASSPASSHLDPPVPTGSWPVSDCHVHPIAGIAGAVTRPWRCTSSR